MSFQNCLFFPLESFSVPFLSSLSAPDTVQLALDDTRRKALQKRRARCAMPGDHDGRLKHWIPLKKKIIATSSNLLAMTSQPTSDGLQPHSIGFV